MRASASASAFASASVVAPAPAPVALALEPTRKSWANIVVNTLSPEEQEIVSAKYQEKREKLREKQEKSRQLRVERRKIASRARLARKYDSDFWYFMVANTEDDTDEARTFRDNRDQERLLRVHLFCKYGPHWLERCEDTIHDCEIVRQWRHEQDIKDERIEAMVQRNIDKEGIRTENEIQQMKTALKAKQITQEDYDDFIRSKDEHAWSTYQDLWRNTMTLTGDNLLDWEEGVYGDIWGNGVIFIPQGIFK